MHSIAREQHKAQGTVPQLCPSALHSKCEVRIFCGGDCRGETYNVTGSLYSPYVACEDRYNSIIKMMWVVAEHPELFETRANEFTFNASREI